MTFLFLGLEHSRKSVFWKKLIKFIILFLLTHFEDHAVSFAARFIFKGKAKSPVVWPLKKLQKAFWTQLLLLLDLKNYLFIHKIFYYYIYERINTQIEGKFSWFFTKFESIRYFANFVSNWDPRLFLNYFNYLTWLVNYFCFSVFLLYFVLYFLWTFLYVLDHSL